MQIEPGFVALGSSATVYQNLKTGSFVDHTPKPLFLGGLHLHIKYNIVHLEADRKNGGHYDNRHRLPHQPKNTRRG